MRVTTLLTLTLVFYLSYSPIASAANINVTYKINTNVNRTPISPYVYGINWWDSTSQEILDSNNYTIRRNGGNRLTGYNWENNFSNAGADWYHVSDNHLVYGLPPSEQLIPGRYLTYFHDASIANGQASVVTLQMAGYVSADGDYEVYDYQTAPSSRWKQVIYAKGAPFCDPPGNPDTMDNYVYMDECVNFLVSRYGYANEPNGVKFYDLDNEPALWFSTHPRIHPVKTLCTELVSRNVALASAVKDVDPCAQILGPVLYGFNAYHSFQDACDWPALQNGYNWFLDYYLDRMKANSVAAGKRLLDVLDLHWYSNAIGDGKLIVFEPPPYSRANAKARMQAPRTLWDPDYLEDSWIATYHSDHLPLLPEVWESINTYYSGTKLSFTEYAYGAENHFSGGIATADVLGIFGKYGVYIATYYPVFGDNNYLDTAFKMYRNYDGNNSMFGDMNVLASMSNKVDSSIYASVSTIDANALHLIVINKNFDNAINGTFNITSPQNFISGRVWRFDSSSPTITETTGISSITNNTFKYTIPSLTVCHIVLQTGTSLTITKCKVTSGKTQYHNDADYNDMKDTFEASGFITLPRDCNDINSVEVNITSVTDDEVIYTETLRDFNATLVNNKGKYTHSAKVYKGQPGKITSLTLNFRKGTFAIKAKNIDLTGLACPVQLGFTIGSYEVSGLAEETVVNGSKKSIPARLMRLYKDTLIVTKAKAKNSTNALSDSLSVSGEIAVTDINDANMNEPNLVTQDVNIVWGDQTFTIPTGSFKAAKSGHSYKCSKINVDPGASADINDGFVTATINLDKCTFTISISKADLVATSGDVEFGINFDVFNETEDLTLP